MYDLRGQKNENFGVMEMFYIFFVEVVVQLYTSEFIDLNSLKMSEFYM